MSNSGTLIIRTSTRETDHMYPNATYDLGTGTARKPNPLDYITKKTACSVAPPGTPHPLWTAFLNRITAGNIELQQFLQRYIGYCCTGFPNEHVFLFAWGTGANGKGTFINTVARIFGDYATVADMNTFIASNTERHPADLAKLYGARLVVAQETQTGRRWDETKNQGTHGWRQDHRPLHATRLFRLHSNLQTVHRRKSQTATRLRRRSHVPPPLARPVHRPDPRTRTRPEPAQQALGARTLGHPAMVHRRRPGMEKHRPQPAQHRPRRDQQLLRRPGHAWPMVGRKRRTRPRSQSTHPHPRPLRLLESMVRPSQPQTGQRKSLLRKPHRQGLSKTARPKDPPLGLRWRRAQTVGAK